MSPDDLFTISDPIALLGWLALVQAPLAPRYADLIAALIIPLLMAVAYSALLLANWSGAPRGYGSLPDVIALFTNPHSALAGWVHYLAFDLLVGAWAVRIARAEQISHLLTLPDLGLIFLFGPAGFRTIHVMRAAYSLRTSK